MHHSLLSNLIRFLFICSLSISPAISKEIDKNLISNQLEIGLNQKSKILLKDIFLEESFDIFEEQYLSFIENYKETKWSIKPINNNENKKYLEVELHSIRNIGGLNYNLKSKQKVEIKTYKSKIKKFEIISQESILTSYNSPLVIKVISPDNVLPGELYEINLIIEKPLDNSLIATGMITIKNNNTNISQKFFGIKPTSSGGIFKYIQAPISPGSQTISAIIAHPKGIYSITKTIQVE